jgi:hypothetical protein
VLLAFCLVNARCLGCLEILAGEPRMLGYSSKNATTQLFIVMKSKHVATEGGMAQFYVGATLGDNHPSFTNQRPKDDSGFGTAPFADAGMWRTLMESGMSLDCSTSSATAYSANAYAFAFASSTVAP